MDNPRAIRPARRHQTPAYTPARPLKEETNMELTHFDENGKAIMVDISAKKDTDRTAEAEGMIFFNSDVADAISKGTSAKGDVIGVATVAGIMSAKRTWELIPMCHNIPLGSCQVIFDENPHRIPVQIAATQDAGSANAAFDSDQTHTRDERYFLTCRCIVKTTGKTGAEMEALTGVSVALLTVYDMCKALDKTMEIAGVRLLKKTGGKSGTIINI